MALGAPHALNFPARARVAAVDIDGEAAEKIAAGIRALGGQALAVQADVSQSAQVQAYVQQTRHQFGRIDCFFNNAGIEGRVAPLAESDEAVWDQVIGVKYEGVFLGLRHVLPVMLSKNRARL